MSFDHVLNCGSQYIYRYAWPLLLLEKPTYGLHVLRQNVHGTNVDCTWSGHTMYTWL